MEKEHEERKRAERRDKGDRKRYVTLVKKQACGTGRLVSKKVMVTEVVVKTMTMCTECKVNCLSVHYIELSSK